MAKKRIVFPIGRSSAVRPLTARSIDRQRVKSIRCTPLRSVPGGGGGGGGPDEAE